MRTRYGTPPWGPSTPLGTGQNVPASRVPDFPRFRGDHTADVVIIGGGLTGSVVAYMCASAGLKTILLEADRIGRGQTMRGAGVMSPEPGPLFRTVAGQHGLRAARLIFDTWRKGALDGTALLKRLRVKCDVEPRDMLLAVATHNERDLRREHDARRDAGLDAAWLVRKQMASRMKLDAAGGLRTRGVFALDPYRACIGIIAAARARRAVCHEKSAVRKVRFTRKFAEVFADGGKIRTAKVIVATGSLTEVYKPLRRHLDDRASYMVLTEPMPAPMRKALGDPRILLRDPGGLSPQIGIRDDRLLISGGDRAATPAKLREAVLVQRTGALMYEVLTRYPAISGLRPELGWDAPYGQAADGLMYIGAHRNYPHHVFAVGGHPASVTGAFVAGRVLLRAVQDAPEKSDEVLGWTR